MKISMRLVAGVILTGLSLACLLLNYMTKVESNNGAQKQSSANAAISSATNPVETAWRVGEPIVHENLAIFPVTSNVPVGTDDFITLDEGLRAGTVVVTELGANGRSLPTTGQRPDVRSNRIPQQRGDGAQVNKLALTNKSGKKLVLLAGEMVVGGKQDRIVGNDAIIESTDEPVPLDVFCVEHGRWSGEAAFTRNRGSSGGDAAYMMASPKVRANAQAKKDQNEVWKEVAGQVSANEVSTSTGDLKSVYEDKRVSRTLESYERALKDKIPGKEVIGVVVAVGGRVISADVFASPKLFQAYWPKMLRSYALEAISSKRNDSEKASVKDAQAFLARANGGKQSSGKLGVYKLTEHQSDADASFELEGDSKSAKVLVHFNRVSKK
jgi:hypothetical protein